MKHIIKGSSFQGLEFFHLDGNPFYSLIKLREKNGALHVVSEQVFQTIEEVVPKLDKKHALLLVINTSQILKKQVPTDSKLSPAQKVIQAFPNLELENFHYDILSTHGPGTVSIGKKEHLNELLSALESKGVVPSRVSLGVSDLGATLPYLMESKVKGSNFQLSKTGDTDFELEPNDSAEPTKFELNGLNLSNTSLLAFSAILGYIIGADKKTSLKDVTQRFENRFQNDRVFDFGLKWGLAMVLAILLINFVFFSHYHGKVMAMDSGHDIEQQQVQLQSIKERIAQKEERLKKVLSASSSKSTFYLDRIALELPNTILLDKMTYQPLLKPIRDGKQIEMEYNSILVSGQSGDKVQFAQWTETLEQKNWIETVEVLNYGYATKNVDEFNLKIEIDEAQH